MTRARALPFPELVKELAATKGVSVERVLSDAWDLGVRGTSSNTLKKVLRGKAQLQPFQIEAVAAALGQDPDVFAEYRLAAARVRLDESVVGLDDALEALALFEAAIGPVSAGGPPPPQGELGRRAAGSPPTQQDQPQHGTRRAAGKRP